MKLTLSKRYAPLISTLLQLGVFIFWLNQADAASPYPARFNQSPLNPHMLAIGQPYQQFKRTQNVVIDPIQFNNTIAAQTTMPSNNEYDRRSSYSSLHPSRQLQHALTPEYQDYATRIKSRYNPRDYPYLYDNRESIGAQYHPLDPYYQSQGIVTDQISPSLASDMLSPYKFSPESSYIPSRDNTNTNKKERKRRYRTILGELKKKHGINDDESESSDDDHNHDYESDSYGQGESGGVCPTEVEETEQDKAEKLAREILERVRNPKKTKEKKSKKETQPEKGELTDSQRKAIVGGLNQLLRKSNTNPIPYDRGVLGERKAIDQYIQNGYPEFMNCSALSYYAYKVFGERGNYPKGFGTKSLVNLSTLKLKNIHKNEFRQISTDDVKPADVIVMQRRNKRGKIVGGHMVIVTSVEENGTIHFIHSTRKDKQEDDDNSLYDGKAKFKDRNVAVLRWTGGNH